MDPKLFDLLSSLVTAYRREENFEPEIVSIEELLERTATAAPGIASEKTQKIFEYIRKLKKPITSHDISVRFHIAKSTSTSHLRLLHEAGLLTKSRVKNFTFWEVKSTSLPVAVPDKASVRREPEPKPEPVVEVRPSRPAPAEPIKPIWPTNPFQTSYPNIRGYDD